MKKKQIGGLAAAVGLFIITGVTSVFSNIQADKIAEEALIIEKSLPSHEYIAVVDVTGVIEAQTEDSLFLESQSYRHSDTLNFIDQIMYDNNNTGIMLYLDTPGGAVYESDELYLKLMEYKENTGRPIWSYMSHMAASGGYYAAMSSDKIFANRNTITGSIGVIMSGVDMTGLYEKLGIKYYSATSGEYKDSTMMTDDQLAILQTMVDETYEQFVDVVEIGRGMTEEEVKSLADGRIYTANQALEKGLIDEIGSLEDMQNKMLQETGAYEFYEMENSGNIFSSFFANIKDLIPKSEAQVLNDIKDDQTSGRLMYYAEQLK